MEEKVLNAALAGLLHDVLSYEFASGFLPGHIRSEVLPYLEPNSTESQNGQLVSIAARLANGKLENRGHPNRTGAETELLSILSRIELHKPIPDSAWFHSYQPLEVSSENTYPITTPNGRGTSSSHWAYFYAELEAWKSSLGKEWEAQDKEDFFITLLSVFRKFLWCVPAENSTAGTDVSLYESARLTSAIAACLVQKGQKQEINPSVLVVRGDLSGIQNFIYRITRPETEKEHVAKRLRGRSFYLTMLIEAAVDWILRELGMPPNCALFVGGGRFDLLLPSDSEERVEKLKAVLDEWLLEQFGGELGLQIASYQAQESDFLDMRKVYQALNQRLEESKLQKWQSQFSKPEFFEPGGRRWHVCSVCQLTPLPEPGTCELCAQHEKIGSYLPQATHLVYCYGDVLPDWPREQTIRFADSPFSVYVAIVREEDSIERLLSYRGRKVSFRLNETENYLIKGTGSSFRFLANAAPRAKTHLRFGDTPPVQKGDVLHFEALAELSRGAKRLGVLKADVDHLGLLMSEGLANEKMDLFPTLTRTAALSSALDIFFAGHLNRICYGVTKTWQQASPHPLAKDIENVFYILYSGGDDLFIVGPWDAILELAHQLNQEFNRFCGRNQNLTLSAGFVQVKPRFPTQKFAERVSEAEKAAKDGGRNLISVFGQTLAWSGSKDSFEALRQLADDLCAEIEANNIGRTLIADLGQVFRQHFEEADGILRPMWTPRLFYTLSRRLNQEAFTRLGSRLIEAMRGGKILTPISIVSLATRKE